MKPRKPPSSLLALISLMIVALVCIHLLGCTGLTYYDPTQACNGYTLICADTVAKLVDMNGNVIKTWNMYTYPAKMFPGGSVMGQSVGANPAMELNEIVQYSWDGVLEWSFSDWDEVNGVPSARVHHDFQRDGNPVGYYAPGQLPQDQSGKVLVLGRLTTLDPEISPLSLFDDVVYEVDWETKEASLVWKSSEHIDELGFDEEARQLIYNAGGDYLHINSLSRLGPNKWYDPDTSEGDIRFHPKNLIMDSRQANIIWIVNMVECEEYAVGQIVWRVGPDYSAGTPEGDKLGQIIGQHHAHMIPEGLPGAGNILVFDNGGFAGYPSFARLNSRILEFDPITLDLVWKYEDPAFFSFYISGMQRLPNGNTLIDEGSVGRIFEVTPAGEKVWEYIEGMGMQFFGRVYRAYRIPPEWVPENPSGYQPWSELYEQPETGGEVPLEEPEPEDLPQETGEPVPAPL